MSSNFIFILFAISFFPMALAPEMSANGIGKKLVLDQFRLMLSTIDMKKSLIVMQEAFNFINELGAMHDISLKRLGCMMAEFNEQITQIGESYRKTKSENQSLQEQLKNRTKENEDNVLKVDKHSQENVNLKKQLADKNQNVDKLSQENVNLIKQLADKNQNADKLSQENVNLIKQLADKNQNVDILSQENVDLKKQLADKNRNVQVMNNSLGQCQKSVQELVRQVEKLNNTVQVMWTRECEQKQHLDKIKPLVQAYLNDGNFDTLRRGLEDVLDHKSEEYKPLQYTWFVWYIGFHGSTQLASLLLCAGLPVDTDHSHGNTMLHAAATMGHLQMVKLLLQRGAGVNARGVFDFTPLILAAHGGHLEVVKYLVQAGADTTARDNAGYTALFWAREKGHTAVEQYLQQLPQ